jgi:hypothetical protein
MKCCGKKKGKSLNIKKALSDFQNCGRTMQLTPTELFELQDKFELYALEDEYGEQIMYEQQFREMLGTLGSFFIGHRIFRIVLNIKRKYAKAHAEANFNNKTSFQISKPIANRQRRAP